MSFLWFLWRGESDRRKINLRTTRQGRLAFARRALLALAAVIAVSCLSPTLPLPPPNRPTIEGPDSTGNVTLSGRVLPGANVYADNLVTGVSAGQKSDPQTGEYRFNIAAQVGDDMVLFYEYDSVFSDRLYFTVPNPIRNTGLGDGGIINAEPDAGR